MSNHLHVDPFAGIAGDMFIGALLQAGLRLADLLRALEPVPITEAYRLSEAIVMRHGIAAVDFKVHTGAEAAKFDDAVKPALAPISSRGPLADAGPLAAPTQPHAHGVHVHYTQIMEMIDHLGTADRAKQRARKIVTALAEAEALVHRMPIEQVHFHEVGAVDSIVDMLGAAAGMEILGIDTVSSGPLPVSRGFVRCEHGKMPVPAPATAYLMRGKPTFGVDRTLEMITPTGAAILDGVCDQWGPPPPMVLRAVGYGAGDRNDPDVPNLLRVFIGTR